MRDEPIGMVLEAKPGCFIWQSSDESVVTVKPLLQTHESTSFGFLDTQHHKSNDRNDRASPSKCSSRAVVTSASTDWERRSSVITAEADNTILKCEATVAPIDRLEILTTDRLLGVEEQELIRVQAFDAEDNVFSTLDSMAFAWEAIDIDDQGDVLRILALKDTEIETTPLQQRMEQRHGVVTDQVVLEGLVTGAANITVALAEPGYVGRDRPSEGKAAFAVMRTLLLEPSQALRVPPAAMVHYTLQTFRRGRRVAVAMPTPHYAWEALQLGETGAVDVDRATGRLEALPDGPEDNVFDWEVWILSCHMQPMQPRCTLCTTSMQPMQPRCNLYNLDATYATSTQPMQLTPYATNPNLCNLCNAPLMQRTPT